jgi:hypothetical protein
MEKTSLEDLMIEISPDFFAPKKHVEKLEQTSRELNNINTRVMETLIQYETVMNQDDVFQLLDEDDDVQFTAGFDRESIMEESKGKVRVLVVNYDKLGLEKDSVLSSLKEWFEEMKHDVIGDQEVEEARVSEDSVNNLLANAHSAKDRLVDLHSDLIDCK